MVDGVGFTLMSSEDVHRPHAHEGGVHGGVACMGGVGELNSDLSRLSCQLQAECPYPWRYTLGKSS